jgi:outer membrane cobalamin receptor
MCTRQVKLLLNGMPFPSTCDGQFDPDTIPIENIARIKITRRYPEAGV